MSPYVELSPSTGGSSTPGGSTTQVQYNNAGAFGGSANLTWNNTTSALSVSAAGTAALPALNFGTANSGFFGVSNNLSMATAGATRFSITNTQVQTTVPFSVPVGAANGTSISFGNNTTGLYGSATTISQAVAGNNKSTLTATDLTLTVPVTLPADPTTALQAVTKQYVDARASTPGILINGGFRINQGGYASAAVLAAGAYGHDQWKAGAAGGNYTFTQLAGATQITITSGKTLIQPIEGVRVAVGGSYVLSWTGTAQARAGVNSLTPSGSYAASPLAIAGQTAGAVMSVEFNAGTLGTVKLESGTIATPFVAQDYATELMACKRYYQGIQSLIVDTNTVSQTTIFPTLMRANPTITGGGAGFTVAAPTALSAQFFQTARSYQDLILDARL